MEKPHAFRRKILIYPKFQLTLIAVNLLIFLFSAGIFFFQANQSIQAVQQMGVDAKLPEGHVFFQFLGYQAELVRSYMLVSSGVVFIVSTVFTLYFSHKLAGPIVRFREELKRIARTGEYQAFQFRQKDFFQELPVHLQAAFAAVLAHKKSPTEKKTDTAA